MWRPEPRAVLCSAVALVVVLSIALAIYAFGPVSPTQHARGAPLGALFVPAATSVLVLQAISYSTLRDRLIGSALFFVSALFATAIVLFLLGCGLYDACSR